jgi:Phosphate-selective porin O and P.
VAYVLDPIMVKGEYLAGTDTKTDKDGWYAMLGYYVLPKKVQAVVKYDTYDADKKLTNNEKDVYTYGINWYLAKTALIAFNYENKKEKPSEQKNDTFQTQFTLAF